ncbi:MAG: DUF3365 domain-containing protein, partial [Gemmataceae bacterium]
MPILFLGLWLGCLDPRRAATTDWSLLTKTQLTAAHQQQHQAALAAREELFGQLMKRLETVLQADGPAQAVAVCKEEAPAIAQTVARNKQLRIGRTSFKLRNPAIQPPTWARPFVEKKTPEVTFAAHRDGRLGVLLPIRLKGQCLICHGSASQLSEAVLQQFD